MTSQVIYSQDAEEAVLGCIIISPDTYDEAAAILKAEDFYLHKHRWIWDAYTRLHESGTSLDNLTLSEELERHNQLEEVGGPAFIAQLLNVVPTSMHIEAYARIVQRDGLRRRLLEVAGQVAKAAYDGARDIDEVLADARALVDVVAERAPKNNSRFQLHSASDALQPQPPMHWVVDQVFSAPIVAIVFGDGGTKKTYAMLSATVCVAAGIDWIGFHTKQCPTLFIDEENGARRISRRIAEVARGYMVDEALLPFFYTTLAHLNLCDPADVEALRKLIVQTGAHFVVIDCWIAVVPGIENENDAARVRAVFNLLRPVAEETETAIVLIHHANRQGAFRGSSDMKNAADMMLFVESKSDSPNIDFSFEKVRDVEPFKFSAVAHFEPGQFFLTASTPTEYVKPLTKPQEFVLRYLTSHGPANIETIMTAADVCSDAQARRAVYSLADLQKVKRVDQGGKGAKAIYAVNQ